MSSPKFATGDDLFDYIVSQGPPVDPEYIKFLQGDEPSGALHSYFWKIEWIAPDFSLEPLFEIVRDNIQLLSGDEFAFDIADMVCAPWDCFA